MLERFDENARTVLARAREEASALGRECIDTEHVLLGVCHQDAKDSDPVLASAGITTQSVRAWLAQYGGRPGGAPDGSLPFTPNVWFVLYQTHVEAVGRQHQSIGPAHVLLALIRCAIVAPQVLAPAAGAPQAPQEDASETGLPETGRQSAQTSPADPDVVAALLRDCEIDLRALHTRAAARANADGAGRGFPFLGACSCLPGRGRVWLWRAAVLAGYAPFAALEIVLAPPATRVIALAAAVIAPIVLYLVMAAVAWPQWRRRVAREDVEPIEARLLIVGPVDAGDPHDADAIGLAEKLVHLGSRLIRLLHAERVRHLVVAPPFDQHRSGRDRGNEKISIDRQAIFTAREEAQARHEPGGKGTRGALDALCKVPFASQTPG